MSNIEWTDATWNPVIGCSPISAGCLNCYAATMAIRMQGMQHAKDYQPRRVGDGVPYGDRKTIRIAEVRKGHTIFTGDVRTLEHRLDEPLSWKKPRKVFVCSMSDLFHDAVPFDFIDKVFAVMSLCPQHTFQVLTKRPDRMAEYFHSKQSPLDNNRWDMIAEIAQFIGKNVIGRIIWDNRGSVKENYYGCRPFPSADELKQRRCPPRWPLPNVWLGTTVENRHAKERIAHLQKCPAAVRFLSCEPLLEDLGTLPLDGIHWVILGAESGSKARVCNVNWLRRPLRQCLDAGVPAFIKQLGRHLECDCNWNPGGWAKSHGHKRAECAGCGMQLPLRHPKGADMAEWPEDLRVRQFPGGATC